MNLLLELIVLKGFADPPIRQNPVVSNVVGLRSFFWGGAQKAGGLAVINRTGDKSMH